VALAPPVGYVPPTPLEDTIRRLFNQHMDRVEAASRGQSPLGISDTFADADDFDVGEGSLDEFAAWEENFDPPVTPGATPRPGEAAGAASAAPQGTPAPAAAPPAPSPASPSNAAPAAAVQAPPKAGS
jgi:hypothetical protein